MGKYNLERILEKGVELTYSKPVLLCVFGELK